MRRRTFLAAATSALATPAWASLGAPAFLAAAREREDRYALCGLTADGQIAFRVPLPGRGHAAAAHPSRAEAVAFARRPGRFALVLDCATGQVRHRLDPPDGHHFYGHGTYLADGRVLVTTENAYGTGDGRLGLWDATDGYRRIDRIPSGGIGPHEVIRPPGTDILAVANGGIRTHPATAREKLNLDTMRPNLTYLQDGQVVEQVGLPDPELSIRHLAARGDGTVAMALQSQRDPSARVPLVATHRRGQVLDLRGVDLASAVQGYIGSVAWSGDGTRLAATGPRGNRAAIWSGDNLDLTHRPDICGAAPAGNGLAFTDGTGGVLTETGARTHPVAWDNHLVPISIA